MPYKDPERKLQWEREPDLLSDQKGRFVAMLFCQLGQARSLREICGGLLASEGKLKHLGLPAASRSTLAYANEHRSWELYRTVFYQLLEKCLYARAGNA